MSTPRRNDSQPSVALVQWEGGIGGAEVLSASLAIAMRTQGVDAQMVFVMSAEPLSERLVPMGVPFHVLGLGRGRDVLRNPRQFAARVAAAGRNGAILPECGFVGAALRIGGYGAPTVGVEHGEMLLTRSLSWPRKLIWDVNRVSGAWADDIEVGVSDFMVDQMRRVPHARRVCRIYNGLDPLSYDGDPDPGSANRREGVVVGFAGRLIPGKGADDVVAALARAGSHRALTLAIAGDGPERHQLAELADRLGVADRVQFRNLVSDMRAFWSGCDIAVVPSSHFIESFGMAALEAMACARPLVAARNGGLPELVVDGVTGTLVPPGDVNALGRALDAYAASPDLRRAHGQAARTRVVERFGIEACAQKYLRCLGLSSPRMSA